MSDNLTHHHGALEQKALTEHQAALYLNTSIYRLRRFRLEGQQNGVCGPRFLKIGRSVRYRPIDLDGWLEQFVCGGSRS